MNEIHRQHSILIIDDRENLSRVLVPQLTQAGYEVHAVNSIVAALERLRHPPSPTFILADRMLDEPIEVRNLARLCETAPGSKVLVYTGQALTDDERYAIRSQGAYRLLDKDFVDQLVKNIDSLTQELDELLALTTELERATSERSRIMAVLAGTDATVSVVDNQFHRWFHSGTELLGSGACRNQCWSASAEKGTAPAT
jgi:DNA-binding NtrC family response regulator